MGYYGARIGQYTIDFHDSDVVRTRHTSKSRDYFSKRKITMNFNIIGSTPETNVTKVVKVPFNKVFKINKFKDRYEFTWNDFDLTKVLFNQFLRKKYTVVITPSICAIDYRNKGKNSREFYLRSDLFDDEIVLSTKKRGFLILDYEQLIWLNKNCFEYRE